MNAKKAKSTTSYVRADQVYDLKLCHIHLSKQDSLYIRLAEIIVTLQTYNSDYELVPLCLCCCASAASHPNPGRAV